MADVDTTVRTSTVLWSEVVAAADPEQQRVADRGDIVYEFAGGLIVKREPRRTYYWEDV